MAQYQKIAIRYKTAYNIMQYYALYKNRHLEIIITSVLPQRQVLHCKQRNLGCSSAEGRSSTTNSGTKAAVLLGI